MPSLTPYETASWVDDKVAIGGYLAAGDEKLLKAAGISHVVSMIRPQDAKRFPGVTYYYAPSEDTVDFDIRAAAVGAAAQTLRWAREGRRVLVHCHAGISRSATAVLLYRMALGDSLAGALGRLRVGRPFVRPNPRFMAVLLRADRDLRRRRAAKPRRDLSHQGKPRRDSNHAAPARAHLLRQDHDLPGAELGEVAGGPRGGGAVSAPPKNLSAVGLALAKEAAAARDPEAPEWTFQG